MSAAALTAVMVLAGLSAAPATTPTPPGEEAATAPWREGVSAERQAEAQKVFEAGNTLFAQKDFVKAAVAYREAVALWDHPSVQYNLAVCLIELDQPIDAWQALERALRYGAAPLSERTFESATRYHKALQAGLAFVTIRCDEPGAEVSFDGQTLFTAPGEARRVVQPGSHQVVASKRGYLTTTRRVDMRGGADTQVLLTLEPTPVYRTTHRWPVAVPWIVAGAGVLVAAAGAPVLLAGAGDMEDYDRLVKDGCPAGCASAKIPAPALAAEDAARTKEAAATALFIAGGAAVITGIVLVALNTAEQVEVNKSVEVPAVSVAPLPGGGAAASMTLSF